MMMMMMKKNVLRFLIVAAACLASSTTTAARPDDVKVTISQGEEVKVNNDLVAHTVITTGDPKQDDQQKQSKGNVDYVDQEIMIGETKVTLGNVNQMEVKPAATTDAAGTSAAAATAAQQQHAVTLLLVGAAVGVLSLASMM
jgi:hypothetical protein